MPQQYSSARPFYRYLCTILPGTATYCVRTRLLSLGTPPVEECGVFPKLEPPRVPQFHGVGQQPQACVQSMRAPWPSAKTPVIIVHGCFVHAHTSTYTPYGGGD